MRASILSAAGFLLLLGACSSREDAPLNAGPDEGETDSGADMEVGGGQSEEEDPTSGGTSSSGGGTGVETGGMGTTVEEAIANSGIAQGAIGAVGSDCRSAADCLEGLECFEDSSFFAPSGELPSGICTAPCTSTCDEVDVLSACYIDDKETTDTADDEGLCLEWCVAGEEVLKCGGNANRICTPLAENGAGLCLPYCLNDAECADGLLCNPALGLCQSEPIEGNLTGEACTADADCAGQVCLAVTETEGVCSNYCAMVNEQGGCQVGRDTDAPNAGVCLAISDTFGTNDLGLCYPLCDSDDDCGLPALYCNLLDEADAEFVERAGLCAPREEGVVEPTDAGAGTDASTPVEPEPSMEDAAAEPVTDAGE